MHTKLFYAFLLYSVLLLFFGLLFQSPVPIFTAIPLLWIMLMAHLFRFEKVKCTRRYRSRRYVEGDVLVLHYKLKGFAYYKIKDALGEYSGFADDNARLKKRIELNEFGKIKLTHLNITSEDVGGMQVITTEARTKDEIKVYPKIEYVRKFSIHPRRTRSLLGDYHSRRKGLGMEFSDIRAYTPGDSMRWINWKATARKNTIMVNEYESERSGDAVILLDVRRFYKGTEEYSKILRYSVRAAATLVTYLSRTKNRVGFVLLGETVDWIYPTYGKRALYLVLEKLLLTKSKKMSHLPFEYAKFIVSRFFPPNSFVILISPLLSWDIDDAIVELMARRYDILVISPSLITENNDFATEILKSERDIRLRRLRLYSTVIDWNVEYPLTKILMVMR